MKQKKRNARQKRYRRGLFAEYIAVLYLLVKGYRILKRRYKTPVGEIDIIARKKDTFVFVEVKARQNIEQGLYSITETSKQRIRRAAEYFGMMNNTSGTSRFNPYRQDARFDVIIFSNWHIRHVQNAWGAGE